MLRRILIITFISIIAFVSSMAQSPFFVKVKSQQFLINNTPYYYIGTNYWYGGLIANTAKGRQRIREELDFLHNAGINNLRVLAAAEGTGLINGVPRVAPAFQPQKGKFNQSVLDGLDFLLYEMSKRDMKAILYLSNNWEWSGGFLQYLNWNGLIPDSVLRKKMNWDLMRDLVGKFYTCKPCMAEYAHQVKLIINRVNHISHKKYSEEPAIMAWELANEPRPMRPAANNDYRKWISETASLIKSLDKNHLITLGHEGEIGTESISLFEIIHTNPDIDYITIHIWPKNWQWFSDTSIQKGMQQVINNTMAYIEKHKAIATKLQKPMVIEEFGLPRNNQSFAIGSSTSLRDDYYKRVFAVWQQSRASNGVLAGCSFWAFGGKARPIKGQVFWKEGDDYMGDPPMEEQGLNTVFDSDASTWKIIESFSKAPVKPTAK